MSRGRARHHTSRRRAYSLRQRDLRERQARLEREGRSWPSETAAAVEVEEGLDFESPTSWGVSMRGRASAA